MKTTNLILLLIIVASVAIIVSLFSKSNPYSDFEKVEQNTGKDLQVIGKLSDKYQIMYIDSIFTSKGFSFGMEDEKGNVRQVYYFDNKPTDFEKSDQVVIVATNRNDSIIAKSLLLKCPSKYNEDKKPEGFEDKSF
ncbi:MAG: cytochrome c maturation protein CcmE [Lentimicrobiaceae bacterium]|nr:cytochrome c maturation protein CcmE [Lentimicrobiaceae bacterium]